MSTAIGNPEMEKALLGCILMEPVRVMHLCREAGVSGDWFTDPAAGILWAALAGMDPDRLDSLTVRRELERRGRSDDLPPLFENECIDSAPTTAHTEHYLTELRECHLRRAVRRIGMEAEALVERDQPADILIADLTQKVLALAPGDTRRQTPAEVYAEVLARWRGGSTGAGIPSRWSGVNKLLGGYRPGKVFIVAARPGEGKSTLMHNEILTWAKAGIPVSVASLEMAESELRGRMLAEDCDISAFRMDVGKGTLADYEFLDPASTTHATLAIRICDEGMTIEQLTSWATSEVVGKGAKVICIDYLQIVGSNRRHESRNVEISAWMNTLRDCAKRLNVPFIVLSQLSRESAREGREPALHDLRDSGSIEQNAYAVLFIHHIERDGREESRFIVSKNRGGPTGHVDVRFERNRQRFEEVNPAS